MAPIVCGTDYSSCSETAFKAALALAGRLREELLLVHAIPFDDEQWGSDFRQTAFKQATVKLEAWAKQFAPDGRVKTSVVWGEPAAQLMTFAEDRRASLLIVGSPGHVHTPLIRISAVSEQLATESKIPTLVIRDGDAFDSWAHGKSMRVLVGVDETLSSDAAVRWVEKLRQVAPVDVVVGHVYYSDTAAVEYGARRPVAPFTVDRQIESLVERDLQQRIPSLKGEGEIFYRVKLGFGRIGDHLVDLAEAERCQLMVVGSHGRAGISRMWSVSAVTLHVSRTAVAVVPPDGATGQSKKPALKRILVATDFSECGNAAVPWAYTLCAAGGEVTLAHVVVGEHTELAPKQPSGPLFVELAAKLRALPGIRDAMVTRTELLHGADPAKAIVEAAARLGADAIVVGSHGRTGMKRAALGSVAEEVLRASHRPVFVARANE